jgi:WD40 repeat protein
VESHFLFRDGVTPSVPIQSYGMRTRLLFLSVVLAACASGPTRRTAALPPPALSAEYAGVYTSTPDEDYFVPCGVEGFGDSVSLRFRDDEPEAPFLKKVSAIRGLPPLTHFVRIRGKLARADGQNFGFQKQELVVDSILDVKELLEPCAGYGVPARWTGIREAFGRPRAMAMSNDRSLVALLEEHQQISIWSTATGVRLISFASLDNGDPNSTTTQMDFSDDGALLAVGGIDRAVRVWRVPAGKLAFSLALKDSATAAQELAKILLPSNAPGWRPMPHSNSYTPARHFAFNKRGTMLATTNLFSTIVWSMKDGKKLAEFPLDNDWRRRAFFLGDDALLMTADHGQITVRSNLDAQSVIRAGPRAAQTDHIALSPDRRTLAVATWTDSVFLWSAQGDSGCVAHVPGFVSGFMAFSPDGNTIAIAGGSSGLYLYDTRTGAPIKSFQNFRGPVSHAWFSADGKSIVTVSMFDDRFRIAYIDPKARPAGEEAVDSESTARTSLAPPPSPRPRTIGATVTGPNGRAVANADISIRNGDVPDSVIARGTTSPGGYFSFNGITFRHVLIRVRAPGFAPAVKYIHTGDRDIDGPWRIQLTPETRPALSPGGK